MACTFPKVMLNLIQTYIEIVCRSQTFIKYNLFLEINLKKNYQMWSDVNHPICFLERICHFVVIFLMLLKAPSHGPLVQNMMKSYDKTFTFLTPNSQSRKTFLKMTFSAFKIRKENFLQDQDLKIKKITLTFLQNIYHLF